MSSVHAAKHILPTAARLWDHALPAAASPALNEEQADAVAAAAEGQGVEEDTALTWAAQDALVERLPQVGGSCGVCGQGCCTLASLSVDTAHTTQGRLLSFQGQQCLFVSLLC
jgi:hypothetical protein